MKRTPKRLLALGLGVVLALLAFELALQAIAYATWLRNDRSPDALPAGATRAVLCVGDSLTWGAEASGAAMSYPAQLQRLLREAGHGEIAVVNGGWPGRTSALVLERLGEQLARFAPELVYVLVGYNDGWDRPREVEHAGDRGERFLLVCRTARFFALVANWLRGESGGEAPAPGADARDLVGTWHDAHDGHELVIRADGRFTMHGVALRWSLDGGELWLEGDEIGRFPVAWERAGAGLRLRAERWEHSYEPGPAPPVLRGLAAAHEALRAQSWRAAADGFRASLAADDLRPELAVAARSGLVQALARLDPAAAAPHLAALQRAWREEPAASSAAALVDALRALGRADEAFEIACAQLERTGIGTGVWHVFHGARLSAAQGRRALQALRAAVERPSRGSAQERAIVWRALAAATVGTDPADAVRCLMRAMALDGKAGPLAETLAHNAATVGPARYAALVDEVAAGGDLRARLRALGAAALGAMPGDDAEHTVLERHLRRIVEHCRARGAVPVLLDYPVPVPEVEAAVRRVSAELAVDVLGIRAAFDAALQTRPRAELVARDGLHCVDAGYGLIARQVFADLQRRL